MMSVGSVSGFFEAGFASYSEDCGWGFRRESGVLRDSRREGTLQAVRSGSGIMDLALPSVGGHQEKEVGGRFSKATNRKASGCMGTWLKEKDLRVNGARLGHSGYKLRELKT